MTVVKFQCRRAPSGEGWQAAELQQFIAVSANAIAAGEASGWESGSTERGDPQLFLIGPPPDYDCILSISRLGETYVIEDGAGRVLCEQHSAAKLAEQAAAALRRARPRSWARGRRLVRIARGLRGKDRSDDGRADGNPDTYRAAIGRSGLTFCAAVQSKAPSPRILPARHAEASAHRLLTQS
jgi:hypothetical protein